MKEPYKYSKDYLWLFNFIKEYTILMSLKPKLENTIMCILCRSKTSPFMIFDLTNIPYFYDSHPAFADNHKTRINSKLSDFEDFVAVLKVLSEIVFRNSQQFLDDSGWNDGLNKNSEGYETIENFKKNYYKDIVRFKHNFLEVCKEAELEYIKPDISIEYLKQQINRSY